MELTLEQAGAVEKVAPVPERLRNYITQFDTKLTDEEFESDRYSYRLLFKKKLAARPGQADKVVEFIDPSSELAKTIDKEYWVKKEVERPKFLPSEGCCQDAGRGVLVVLDSLAHGLVEGRRRQESRKGLWD